MHWKIFPSTYGLRHSLAHDRVTYFWIFTLLTHTASMSCTVCSHDRDTLNLHEIKLLHDLPTRPCATPYTASAFHMVRRYDCVTPVYKFFLSFCFYFNFIPVDTELILNILSAHLSTSREEKPLFTRIWLNFSCHYLQFEKFINIKFLTWNNTSSRFFM